MRLPGPLLMVGCGRMGGALLDGWLKRGVEPGLVAVVEPDAALRASLRERGVGAVADLEAVAGLVPAVVLLAVKPQVMPEVLPPLAPHLSPSTLVVSIAAGIAVATIEAGLGPLPVVRVMPNTPAAVGRGISALYAAPRVDPEGRTLAEGLMRAVGDAVWLDDEEAMHAVTALSGSGPAYVFHLVEAMAAAGVRLDLDPGLAMRLARATVAGGGALLDASPDDAATLRTNVTSKGGTTAAALGVLMGEGGLSDLMASAVAAAAKRSRELA
ncbi:MAG: pyrroline-5-carboxylate reductase [Geminicoccaceae bacterium]|nr:pyrroline-5-carboxylate reductase [Geminicoccaceae bacterium]